MPQVDEPVWALVFFDLPVKTKEQRRAATGYRNYLLELGFSMVQLSVYAKYLINKDGYDWLAKHISIAIPFEGKVRMCSISDYEWSHMLRFEGKKRIKSENIPQQLSIFSIEELQ
jgi:CRISPR-associated protein Cas2